MGLKKEKINGYGDTLYEAMRARTTIAPLTDQSPEINIEEAYQISLRMLERRLADGERMIGKKIGVTSKVVMDMLNVRQPDFGFLTDTMVYGNSAEVPVSTQLIQPKAEGEIAFVLKHDLKGPGVTNADVIAATDFVMPCFEIVDSRITDWKIKIQDTIADNASCGVIVLGDKSVSPLDVDLATCGIVVSLNGEIISTGAGAAAMGSPVNAVTWLANTLGAYGIELKAGDIILSGSLVPLQSVKPGDSMHMEIGGIGQASARFV
ncbi:MAG: 2-oxopent-4-enoate/cis-2-oxohex-4-enoate hydratase [Gammaproteobacteria bacterium]|jgi:2-oxopent-4-enoate/cis-2-oxohex-4-enoate hydratase